MPALQTPEIIIMWKKDSETPDQEPEIRSTPVQASVKPAGGSGGTSVIGGSIVLKGEISGNEDLVIKGRVEGTLELPNNDVQVDPEGKVKADLKAKKISVAGHVEGNLTGSERVVIQKSGRVQGNIVASRVVLEDGCQFMGSVEMKQDSSSNVAGQKPSGTEDQSKVSKADQRLSSPGIKGASGTP